MPCRVAVLIVAVVLLSSCSRTSTDPSAKHTQNDSTHGWFRDITTESGLDFVQYAGSTGKHYLPEMSCAGVALFDAEGDGDLDLYLTSGCLLNPDPVEKAEHENAFYRQTLDMHFENATRESGLGDRGYGLGCAVGDIDNDGDPDLVVTNYGPDRLYENDGSGRFREVPDSLTTKGLSSSAAFFDYDRDGYLDLYVGVYVEFDPDRYCFDSSGVRDYCGPKAFPPLPDALFHNRFSQSGGRFEDVSVRAGLHTAKGAALGVVCADLDEDGWQDVYVANDGYANQLWKNERDGTFVDEAVFQGVALNMNGQPEAGMGVVAADFDGDLHLDLFVTHLREETNTLYLNQGAGAGFVDATGRFGVGAPSIPYTGFGTAAFDVDHDRDLDLVVCNGAVLRGKRRDGVELPEPWDRYAEPNLFFLNEGAGKFREAGELTSELCGPLEISRGLAAGDLDGDGDLDLLLGNIEGPARIYENTAPKGNWLQVRCTVEEWKRDAVGARVVVRHAAGADVRTIGGGSSFLSFQPDVAHFGLGDAERVDEILVQWPDGSRERFPGTEANQEIELVLGQGEAIR